MAYPYFITFGKNYGGSYDLFTQCTLPVFVENRKKINTELSASGNGTVVPTSFIAIDSDGNVYENVVDSNFQLVGSNLPTDKCFCLLSGNAYLGNDSDQYGYMVRIKHTDIKWQFVKEEWLIKQDDNTIAVFSQFPFTLLDYTFSARDQQNEEDIAGRTYRINYREASKYLVLDGNIKVERNIIYKKVHQDTINTNTFGLITTYEHGHYVTIGEWTELDGILLKNVYLIMDNNGNISKKTDYTITTASSDAKISPAWQHKGATINNTITTYTKICISQGQILGNHQSRTAFLNMPYTADGVVWDEEIIQTQENGNETPPAEISIDTTYSESIYRIINGIQAFEAVISESMILTTLSKGLSRWTFLTSRIFGNITTGEAIDITLPVILKHPQFKQKDTRYTKLDGTSVLLTSENGVEYEAETDYIPYEWHEKIARLLLCESITYRDKDHYYSPLTIYKTDNYQLDWDNTTETDCGKPLLRATFKVQVQGVERNSIGI